MRLVRLSLALALAVATAVPALAYAAEGPKSTKTSKTLYLSQDGCGSTASPGQLVTVAVTDSGDGCGDAAGVPLTEAEYQVSGPGKGNRFTSVPKVGTFVLDTTKKLTGQMTAQSWPKSGGGVGTVSFDLKLAVYTTADDKISFPTVTISAAATPTGRYCEVPFSMSIPAAAKGKKLGSVVLTVIQHGLNFPMSGSAYSGESYLVLPLKAK